MHEVAQAANPAARVAYVDSDPVAAAHAARLLADVPNVQVLRADLREPATVIRAAAQPEPSRGGLDFSRPVGVLLVSVLPFIPDHDDPAGIVAAYRDATVPGSYLTVSHGTNDYQPEAVGEVEGVYTSTTQPGVFRGRDQVLALMPGYELLEPGLVDAIHWRPQSSPAALPDPLGGDVARYSLLAGVGRRR